jgi:hypothetical protein
MRSRAEQAAMNLAEARDLRASGKSYRQIGRHLKITSGQLCHIRKQLKREKAARTRLYSAKPQASDRELPVGQTALPAGLRARLTASGYQTLGDLADRLSDPDAPRLEALAGIGPHRASLVKGLLDQFGLLVGPSDLQAAVERIFPELSEEDARAQT